MKARCDLCCLCLSVFLSSEYDSQLAPAGTAESGMASSSYLEPNLNHSAVGGCGVKSRSGMPSGSGVGTSGSAGALERPPGSMDRVLKIFHYFETNSEPCTWASNIRHGDATDVRVRHKTISLLSRHPISIISLPLYFFILVSTGYNPEDSRNPQIALCVLTGPPSDSSALWRSPLVTPWFGRVPCQGEIWETAPPRGMEVKTQLGWTSCFLFSCFFLDKCWFFLKFLRGGRLAFYILIKHVSSLQV